MKRYRYGSRKSESSGVPLVQLCGGGPGDGEEFEARGRSVLWFDIAGFVHSYAYDLSSLEDNRLIADYVGIIGRTKPSEE